MTRAILAQLATHQPTADDIRASVSTALSKPPHVGERLEGIAAELGELMAETTFAPLDRLAADHRRFRERFSIGERK